MSQGREGRDKGGISPVSSSVNTDLKYPDPAVKNGHLLAFLTLPSLLSVNRDYLRAINVQIKVYNDKLWFYNVGGLPEDWDTEKLLSSHASMSRNPLIFNVFYPAGIVESVGSGIERMMQALKEAGLPELKIEASHLDFTLVFLKDVYTEEYLRNLGLNERQIKAVMYVKERGRITNREYQEVCRISKATATRDLSEPVNKGVFLIHSEGKRDIHYTLSSQKQTKRRRVK